MLTPAWESGAGALAALLNGSSNATLRMADVYTFTLASGTVLRYTSADATVVVNGVSWSVGPVLQRGSIKLSVGISVDTLQVDLAADPAIQVGGVGLVPFIVAGGFVNARLDLYRVFYGPGAGLLSPTGMLVLFTGRVAEITGGRHLKTLQVKSDTELLDVMLPREVYQAGCLNTLFDAACGVVRASFTFTGTATGASDASRTSFPHAMAQAAGYFELGVITFTSGPNSGISRTVRHHTAGAIVTSLAWPFAVANGHAFSVTAGCDKMGGVGGTCDVKFSNLARFRGMPYVPAPSTVT
jgi:uncharacterized phage protein (TIGR02218 family)